MDIVITSTQDCLNRVFVVVWYPINNYINASATVFVNDISHELTLDSNYTSDYAIESANDNGIHVLPIECQYLRQCVPRHCMYADLHYLNYPLDYQAGKQW